MCKDITTVSFILQYLKNGTGRPYGISLLGFTAEFCQGIGNFLTGATIQIHHKNKFNDFSFFFINDKVSVFIMIVPEEYRCKEDSSSKTHLNRCIHDLTFGMTFFLRKRSHER